MTATAQISVQEVRDAVLVPNAASRFAPPASTAQQRRSLPGALLRRMPQFRPASQKAAMGADRRIWVLQNGEPAAVSVTTGATDGRKMEIGRVGIMPGQHVSVDSVTAK
ncbi:hypothetical protein [Microvirga makkahensis]|uniref:Uncharacterized protein n=1 Tax=Microvirga makkahensis TaxID=1128670 RepID=A0A7X3SND8_9HYPH|nr:hypothetical protein [Microvirga makkahensis]MXQ11088.1 hypothetical protein [Microvirga makkahensis]